MTDDGIPSKTGVLLQQRAHDTRQRPILDTRVGKRIRPLKFDTDRKIIAPGSATPAGYSGMPGTSIEGDKLRYAPAAIDKDMRTHTDILEGVKGRVRCTVQLVTEQGFNAIAAKRTRR